MSESLENIKYDDYNYTDNISDYDDDESDYDKFTNSINSFLNDNYYNVILLTEDIKSHFYSNPDFLCKLNSHIFINIIVDLVFHQYIQTTDDHYILSFIENFQNEIDISYNIISNFLSQFDTKIDYYIWCQICLKYSYLKKSTN